MVMSRIFTVFLGLSVLAALITGQGASLSASVLQGAQAGITVSLSLAGALCLWSGVGGLLDAAGITRRLAALLRPALSRIFPASRQNHSLAGHLSANICANLLGLGNAATPMGIAAARELRSRQDPSRANDELCRLVVLNTASIQLIPANVAALRLSLGCETPFDILPSVWITSLLSAGAGLCATWLLGKVWDHD